MTTPPSSAKAKNGTPYEKSCYCAITLDPLHVGTGGYRLGRVDNTIVREPGTNLPKVPGTSIAGVARAYSAMSTKGKYGCAGKGGDEGKNHCGKEDCRVCVPYGYSKRGDSFQGLAQFSDARILFFPVRSMRGPVWVTCPSVLADFGLASDGAALTLCNKLGAEDSKVQTAVSNGKPLNLGWLYFVEPIPQKPVSWADDARVPDESKLVLETILERLVLVPDGLFSRVVNDNLEVRTSVAIDPATGAADSGALYSYEAIPRATVLWSEVVFSKKEFFKVGKAEITLTDDKIKESVWRGLELMEHFGVGGMSTRGMGRLRLLRLKPQELPAPAGPAASPSAGVSEGAMTPTEGGEHDN
ncbi:MAG: type III-B CRISPR module RAMP protein Cmr4 [Chloroflexi bacterium]|nr:type III-B CRISPR module RAMP protein Cmr4 [Chloroflexota bacterium]